MEPAQPFTVSARMYDIIYEDQMEYPSLATALVEQLCAHGRSAGTLLEVACGTGLYLDQLARSFDVVGTDISSEMLDMARRRLPAAELVEADMRDFDLGRRFDVVVCLFSSIGYMTTRDDLAAAYANFARHLAPGGTVVVEPWFRPDVWEVGRVTGTVHTGTEGVVVRLSRSDVDGSVSVMDMHHLGAVHDEPIVNVVERHRMGLFRVGEHLAAFAAAGLDADYDDEGLTGRGLYFATAAS